MSRQIVHGILAAAVANAGTFTVSYPTGTTRGNFSIGADAKLVINNQVLSQPADIGLSYGAASVTVTNRTGAAWAQGSIYYFQFDQPGAQNAVSVGGVEIYTPITLARIDLGSPLTLDADGICAAQNVGAAGDLLINGALAAGGVVVLDVPRNLIADSGGADDAILTIYGTDVHGDAMIETITLNGTTAVPGLKAFKRVTRVAASKAIANSAFLGTGDVLGLPVRLPSAGHILKELEDGVAATAGTTVAGLALDTESTATTADVRGTYDPNSACDGSKAFALVCALPDPAFLGNPQYAG
jgi:hypothetical protein